MHHLEGWSLFLFLFAIILGVDRPRRLLPCDKAFWVVRRGLCAADGRRSRRRWARSATRSCSGRSRARPQVHQPELTLEQFEARARVRLQAAPRLFTNPPPTQAMDEGSATRRSQSSVHRVHPAADAQGRPGLLGELHGSTTSTRTTLGPSDEGPSRARFVERRWSRRESYGGEEPGQAGGQAVAAVQCFSGHRVGGRQAWSCDPHYDPSPPNGTEPSSTTPGMCGGACLARYFGLPRAPVRRACGRRLPEPFRPISSHKTDVPELGTAFRSASARGDM